MSRISEADLLLICKLHAHNQADMQTLALMKEDAVAAFDRLELAEALDSRNQAPNVSIGTSHVPQPLAELLVRTEIIHAFFHSRPQCKLIYERATDPDGNSFIIRCLILEEAVRRGRMH